MGGVIGSVLGVVASTRDEIVRQAANISDVASEIATGDQAAAAAAEKAEQEKAEAIAEVDLTTVLTSSNEGLEQLLGFRCVQFLKLVKRSENTEATLSLWLLVLPAARFLCVYPHIGIIDNYQWFSLVDGMATANGIIFVQVTEDALTSQPPEALRGLQHTCIRSTTRCAACVEWLRRGGLENVAATAVVKHKSLVTLQLLLQHAGLLMWAAVCANEAAVAAIQLHLTYTVAPDPTMGEKPMMMVREMAAAVSELLQEQASEAERKRKVEEKKQSARRSSKKAADESLKVATKMKHSGLSGSRLMFARAKALASPAKSKSQATAGFPLKDSDEEVADAGPS